MAYISLMNGVHMTDNDALEYGIRRRLRAKDLPGAL